MPNYTADDQINNRPLLFKKRSYTQKFVSYDKQEKYYAGSDVLVYFNTVWVPEITSIQFSAGPKDAPIYSYAHEYFNAVTKGTYIVSGTITINFVETGYLNKVLRTVWNDYLDKSNFTNLKNKIVDQDRYDRAVDTLITDKRRNNTFADVEDAKKVLKDRIWGTKDTSGQNYQMVYRPDQLTALKGFYDDDGKGNKVYKSNVPPLNLIIIYGNPKAEHQVKKLSDVRFLEYSQTINNDGTPIQEVYSFIARDMDNPEDEEVGTNLTDSDDNTPTLVDVEALTKLLADGLFDYVTRTNSLSIYYDTKYMYDRNSYVMCRDQSSGYFAYQGKDHLSMLLMHGFTFPYKYMKDNQLGVYDKIRSTDMGSLRGKALVLLIDSKKDLLAKRQLEREPDTLLPNDIRLAEALIAYIAAILDYMAFINPYATIRNTHIVSRFVPSDEDILESGYNGSPIIDRKDLNIDTNIIDRHTNTHLPFEKLMMDAQSYDLKKFNMDIDVFGKTTTSITDLNQHSPVARETMMDRNTKHRMFEILHGYSSDYKAYEGQIHMSGYLNARLDALPAPAKKNVLDPAERLRAAYNIPEDYTKEGSVIYDDTSRPMVSWIRPFTTVNIGGSYTLQYKDSDGVLQTKFPLPRPLLLVDDIDCLVFVDHQPTYFPNGNNKYTEAFSFTHDKTNKTFEVTLTGVKRQLTSNTVIQIVLINRALVNINSNSTYFTPNDYIAYRQKYKVEKKRTVYIKKEDKFVEQKLSELLLELNRRIVATRMAALTTIPIYTNTISKFTGLSVRKYINKLFIYSTKFQYQFDLQRIVDGFISDLQTYRTIKFVSQNSAGTTATATGQSTDKKRDIKLYDTEMLRKTFRDRFLKNYDNYITSGNVVLKLVGKNKRDLLVTCQLNTPSNNFIKTALQSTKTGETVDSGNTRQDSRMLDINYRIVDIDAQTAKTTLAGGLHLNGISNTASYYYSILNGIKGSNSLIQSKNISQNGCSTLLMSPKYFTIVPESTDSAYETIDNVLLGYEYNKGEMKDNYFIEPYNAEVGTIGTSGSSDGNILYMNTFGDANLNTKNEYIIHFQNYGNPYNTSKYFNNDKLVNLEASLSPTKTIFKRHFGTLGIDVIYGAGTQVDTVSDPDKVDAVGAATLAIRSVLHSLFQLKNISIPLKMIGDKNWPKYL